MQGPANLDDDALARVVEHVADRLRHLDASRLRRVGEPVRRHLAALAALALSAEGLPPRPLPEVPDSALGDVVAVLGHDLSQALRRSPDDHLRVRAAAVLTDLRRCLP